MKTTLLKPLIVCVLTVGFFLPPAAPLPAQTPAFRFGTTANGGIGIENSSQGAMAITNVTVTLPPSTFFDSASTPPGVASLPFSVIATLGSVVVTLPNDAATDGQRTAAFTFSSFDPGDAVSIACDYDLYASPDGAGDPNGAVVVASFDNGSVVTGTVVPTNSVVAGQNYQYGVIGPIISPPFITTQPGSQTVFQTDTATFAVVANGTPPPSYQWQFGGGALAGATDPSLVLTNVTLAQAGGYFVVASNSAGSATSSVATLTVIPTVPLEMALNSTDLVWVTDGALNWHGLTNLSHDGVAAAQAGPISDGQSSRLRTTVAGPGTLTFWWKVSSESNADFLTFSVSGTAQAAISGEVDWEQRTVYIPDGPQTLEWAYSKDAYGSAGQDKAWVDQVSYTSGPTTPFFVTQPVSQSTFGGVPVTFAAAAAGTPQLAFQWRLHGSNIAGATLSSFTIANPTTSDGPYSVRVANGYGSIISSNAFLAVVPFAAAGDNGFGQINVSVGATNAIAIAAGAWHSLALRADGTVLAWGNNWSGQSDIPPNLVGVVAIAAGGYHSLAVKADRTVIAWGANDYGQASPPSNVSNVIAITAGTWHSLALRADGTVAAWGENSWGQSAVPPLLTNVIAITAAGSHNLALRSDSTVVAWGENTDAQGFYAGQSTVPPGLSNVVGIGAGEYHSLAARADGTVVAWGANSQGQCEPSPGLADAVAVAGGGSHSLALKSDGTVAAWGANANGQCNLPPALTGVVAMAAGSAHTLLLLGNNTAAPQLLYPSRDRNQFTLVLQTFYGKTYTLEYKNSLTATSWTALPAIPGNGAMQFLTDPAATSPQRLYRVGQQ